MKDAINKRKIVMRMAAIAKREHYYCDDPWYSCPKAEGGCADESNGEKCICGADSINEEIELLLKKYNQLEMGKK